MKVQRAAMLAVTMAVAGCASPSSAPRARTSEPPAPSTASSVAKPAPAKIIVTRGNLLTGTVLVYNAAGRFVVLDFPPGKMPGADQRMFLYREGLKVGEVKITGPERDHNTVADVISGEARKGDQVRDQ